MKYQFLLFIIVSLLLVGHANAHSFSPSIVYMSPSGNTSSVLFTISNPENRIIPIDISVYELTKDLDGQPVEGNEVIDDFIIYPAQFLLKPNEVTSIQLRWIGEPKLAQERTFTLFCRELPLPVDGSDQESADGMSVKINVLINYAVRVYVTPPKVKSDIVIASVDIEKSPSQSPALIVTAVNKGDKHGKLIEAELVVTSQNVAQQGVKPASVVLNRADIPGFATAIFANSQRRFVIPWPKEIPFGPVKTTLKNVLH